MNQTLQTAAFVQPTNVPVISIRDLRHRYGKQDNQAVAGINLDIYQGR